MIHILPRRQAMQFKNQPKLQQSGNSSHEIRTWIAAYSALGAAGPYRIDYSFYRPIKEYIAGFAVTTARTS